MMSPEDLQFFGLKNKIFRLKKEPKKTKTKNPRITWGGEWGTTSLGSGKRIEQ